MEAEGDVKDECSGRSPKVTVSFTPPKDFHFSCTKVTGAALHVEVDRRR
ncbi:MAG: hypothetical protein JWO39_128 [Gemmatimonadetes bacterium]|nr:hypothetical protein [Gemmatimonadota bacterium]